MISPRLDSSFNVAASLTRRGAPLLLLALGLVALATGCAANKPAPPARPAAFWPPYPDAPRIQFLTSYRRSTDVEPPKSKLDELVLGKEVQQVLAVNKPYGVKMWNGRIYVCDIRNLCVTCLDLRQHRTLILGRSGSDTMTKPVDIAIADDGTKYVADLGRGQIYILDAQDRHVGNFGHKDFSPGGIAIFQDELYVTDTKAQRVEVLSRKNGQVLRTIGGPGPEPGQFVMPLGIAVDSQGNVFVMDVFKCQLFKFDRQGKLAVNFGTISANVGGFVRPKQIAVDKDGIIYVADSAFQNVQLLDQAGRVYTFFGSAGSHPGAMFLPVGISIHDGDLDLFKQYVHPAFEPERLILVTNQFGDNKVSVYALGHLKPGKTVEDISASKGMVPSGTSDQPGSSGAPQPTTQQAPDDTLGGPELPSSQPATQPALPGQVSSTR